MIIFPSHINTTNPYFKPLFYLILIRTLQNFLSKKKTSNAFTFSHKYQFINLSIYQHAKNVVEKANNSQNSVQNL